MYVCMYAMYVCINKYLCYRCKEELSQLTGGPWRLFTGWTDIFYLPRQYAEDFIMVIEPFIENKVHVDLAIGNTLRCLAPSEQIKNIKGRVCFNKL